MWIEILESRISDVNVWLRPAVLNLRAHLRTAALGLGSHTGTRQPMNPLETTLHQNWKKLLWKSYWCSPWVPTDIFWTPMTLTLTHSAPLFSDVNRGLWMICHCSAHKPHCFRFWSFRESGWEWTATASHVSIHTRSVAKNCSNHS